MPYNDRASKLTAWLHRKGVARRINSTHGERGWMQCTVDTVLPLSALARVANRWDTPRLVGRTRIGRMHWRWVYEHAENVLLPLCWYATVATTPNTLRLVKWVPSCRSGPDCSHAF